MNLPIASTVLDSLQQVSMQEITRDNIVAFFASAIGREASNMLIRQSATGNMSDPNLRVRITPNTNREFYKSELKRINETNARFSMIGVKPVRVTKTRTNVVLDYDVKKAPSLKRTNEQRARAVLIGNLIDHAIDTLGRMPIMPASTLETFLLAECRDANIVYRAIRFLLDRSLMNMLNVESSYFDERSEKDVAISVRYVVSASARMQIKGSKTTYGLSMLLETAAASAPRPLSTRTAPKRTGRMVKAATRAKVIAERERDQRARIGR